MSAIQRWNPFQEMESMRSMMDRWFDDSFGRLGVAQGNQSYNPAVDLVQTENGYEVHANMPGYKPEEIDINVERDVVTLKAQHNEESEKKEANYIYRERRSGSFYRTFRLPDAVDADKAEAKMENGVLTLSLPRLAQTQTRKIQISNN
jgi:HSP20 family protein